MKNSLYTTRNYKIIVFYYVTTLSVLIASCYSAPGYLRLQSQTWRCGAQTPRAQAARQAAPLNAPPVQAAPGRIRPGSRPGQAPWPRPRRCSGRRYRSGRHLAPPPALRGCIPRWGCPNPRKPPLPRGAQVCAAELLDLAP